MPTVQSETFRDIVINPNLTDTQRQDLDIVIKKHESFFSDLPGSVDQVKHSIPLIDDTPVNVKQYPIPFHVQEAVNEEVKKMLSMDIIEPSSSPFAAPVLLIKKPDKSNRFVIDFRALNGHTQFDAEPIPDVDALFAKLHEKKFFSKIDLAKGYWQIDMLPEDRPKTAFRTPQGLFQFKRMPFGLKTAPSTFARMMNQLNLDEFDAVHFFDDILLASDDWASHVNKLGALFAHLQSFGLTARPTKVELGSTSVEFLGHVVGQSGMSPIDRKVKKLLSLCSQHKEAGSLSFGHGRFLSHIH